jgi:hypothetical protein
MSQPAAIGGQYGAGGVGWGGGAAAGGWRIYQKHGGCLSITIPPRYLLDMRVGEIIGSQNLNPVELSIKARRKHKKTVLSFERLQPLEDYSKFEPYRCQELRTTVEVFF